MGVEIKSSREVSFRGRLVAVDPVSDTAILRTKQDVIFVPRVDWSKLTVLDAKKEVLPEDLKEVSSIDLEKEKCGVVDWLRSNGLDVEICGEEIKIAGGAVTVE